MERSFITLPQLQKRGIGFVIWVTLYYCTLFDDLLDNSFEILRSIMRISAWERKSSFIAPLYVYI